MCLNILSKSATAQDLFVRTRDALTALKAPLSNKRDFKKKLEAVIKDEETRNKLMKVLGKSDAGGGDAPAEGSTDAPAEAGG